MAEATARWAPLNQPFIAKTWHTHRQAADAPEIECANSRLPGEGSPWRLVVFCFLKTGFFSVSLQKVCGSGDLNASPTSQHFEEQPVSGIPYKQTYLRVNTVNVPYQMSGSVLLGLFYF